MRSQGGTERGKEEIGHKIGSKAVMSLSCHTQTSTKNTSVTVRVGGIVNQQQASHLQFYIRNSGYPPNQFSLTPPSYSQCQPQGLRTWSPGCPHMLWMSVTNPRLHHLASDPPIRNQYHPSDFINFSGSSQNSGKRLPDFYVKGIIKDTGRDEEGKVWEKE